jgi:hypothetical protein
MSTDVGAISNICCNLSKYEKCICINVWELSEYTHIYGRCTGTSGSLCMTIQRKAGALSMENVAKIHPLGLVS